MEDRNSDYWPFKLLRMICPAQLVEEIEGDVLQKFIADIEAIGIFRAKRRLIWRVVSFCRPGIISRNRYSSDLLQSYLIRNYLKIGFRNLIRQKVFSFINVFGLALGISVFLVIWRYVDFELSYDTFHKKSDRIYRAFFTSYENGEQVYASPRFGFGLGPALLEDLPEVESFVRTREIDDDAVISYSDRQNISHQFREDKIQFVDSTFFSIFTYDFIAGNTQQPLDNPFSIVITESVAKRYFGKNSNPIGQTLHVFTQDAIKGDYEITAVVKDPPENSNLSFDFLIPIHNLLQLDMYRTNLAEWNWVNFITYVVAHKDTDVNAMNSKTDALLTKYTGPNEPGSFIFTFQPLRKIHEDDQSNSTFGSVPFFGALSIFILVIAWVNAINLSTARATERSKEAGVRKALGAGRGQLIRQFLVESFLLNFISVVLAAFMYAALLPLLGQIIGRNLSFEFTQFRFSVVLGALLVLGWIIPGLYPAFVLSSLKTNEVMKGLVTKSTSGFGIRKGLTVFQFTASLLLITLTFTIYRQVQFMWHHENGMNTAGMLVVDGPKITRKNHEESEMTSFKDQLMRYPSILSAATSESIPGSGFSFITGMIRLGEVVKENQRETIHIVRADYDFIKTFGIEFLAGRAWDVKNGSDQKAVLVNEASLAPFHLGTAEAALNEKVIIDHRDTMSVVGVFRNVSWSSLHNAPVPMLLFPQKILQKRICIRIDGNAKASLSQIEKLYALNFPGNPFNYYFLDDFFNQQYTSDLQFGKIVGVFSGLAILIACLGLFGLVSFTISRRSKEISVRKVLGASVRDVSLLLSREFILTILIASAISFPILVYGLQVWLNGFAFRIDLSWDLYLIPVVGIFIVGMAAVCLQTIKTAVSNPVKGLRSE